MTDPIHERVLGHVDEGYLAFDADGAVRAANRRAGTLLGEEASLVGRDVATLPHPIGDRLGEALPDDGVTLRLEDLDRSVSVEPVPVDGLDGVDRLVVLRDVTERLERSRGLQWYETLLDLLPDTVVVTDADGNHVDIHGAKQWSGYTKEELIGEPISVTTPPEDVERGYEAAARLYEDDDREKVTYEQEVVTKAGELIPHETHTALLPPEEDGTVPGAISVLRDISERKERERALARQNERLEQFASVVSHDLRNPLNVAHARVKNALRGDDAAGLESADDALSRMNELIEDLLALARMGEAVGETEPVSVADVARDAWQRVEAPDAALDVDGDATVRADPGRLSELFGNLFRNCVEHAGPAVSIRVGPTGDDDGPVEGFYVADDGPGVPPDEREAVFERGFTGADDGTGFGLAIVREIAEAHGWSVSLTAGSDGGARFEFDLGDPAGDDEGSTR